MAEHAESWNEGINYRPISRRWTLADKLIDGPQLRRAPRDMKYNEVPRQSRKTIIEETLINTKQISTMTTTIEEQKKKRITKKTTRTQRLYNSKGIDYSADLQVKSIDLSDECTRIDFLYRSSTIYINGGWISMEKGAYIQPAGSSIRYGLWKAIGIPLAPRKLYFKRQGEFYTYTLIFPALPAETGKINIIEKEGPGNYFNFYGIDYSKWISIPCASDLPLSGN
jgi:hypothetical protein